MQAVQVQQPYPPAPVPEEHEILAHDAQAQRNVAEVARKGHGLPEAAEILPARGARPDAGQLRVVWWHRALEVAAVRHVPALRGHARLAQDRR